MFTTVWKDDSLRCSPCSWRFVYRELKTETSTGLCPASFWHSVVLMRSARLKTVGLWNSVVGTLSEHDKWYPLPPIDTIWAMMIVWRTRGDYRTARAVLEAIIAFSAMHTYYEQLLQVKQICLCLTEFTSLCLDAYVFLCSLVFHCMHVVLL